MVGRSQNIQISMELTSRGRGLVADLDSGRWMKRTIEARLNKESWAMTFSRIAEAEIANSLKNINVAGSVASTLDISGSRKTNYGKLAKHYKVVYYGSNQYGIRVTVRATELGKIYWNGYSRSYKISTNSSSMNRGNWYGSKITNAEVLRFVTKDGEIKFAESVTHPPIPSLKPLIRAALMRSIDKTNLVINMAKKAGF